MENYQTGDFGIASFHYNKKKIRVGIIAFGQITGIEKKVISFHDDLQEYIIDKKDFVFEKKPEPVKK